MEKKSQDPSAVSLESLRRLTDSLSVDFSPDLSPPIEHAHPSPAAPSPPPPPPGKLPISRHPHQYQPLAAQTGTPSTTTPQTPTQSTAAALTLRSNTSAVPASKIPIPRLTKNPDVKRPMNETRPPSGNASQTPLPPRSIQPATATSSATALAKGFSTSSVATSLHAGKYAWRNAISVASTTDGRAAFIIPGLDLKSATLKTVPPRSVVTSRVIFPQNDHRYQKFAAMTSPRIITAPSSPNMASHPGIVLASTGTSKMIITSQPETLARSSSGISVTSHLDSSSGTAKIAMPSNPASLSKAAKIVTTSNLETSSSRASEMTATSKTTPQGSVTQAVIPTNLTNYGKVAVIPRASPHTALPSVSGAATLSTIPKPAILRRSSDSLTTRPSTARKSAAKAAAAAAAVRSTTNSGASRSHSQLPRVLQVSYRRPNQPLLIRPHPSGSEVSSASPSAKTREKLQKQIRMKGSVEIPASVSGQPPPLIHAPHSRSYVKANSPSPQVYPSTNARAKEVILREQRQKMLAENRRKLEERTAQLTVSADVREALQTTPPQGLLERPTYVNLMRAPDIVPPPRLKPFQSGSSQSPPKLIIPPQKITWNGSGEGLASRWAAPVILRPRSTQRQTQEDSNVRAVRIVGGKVERSGTGQGNSTTSTKAMRMMRRPKLIPAGSPVKRPVIIGVRDQRDDVMMVDEKEVEKGNISREKLEFMAALGLVTPNKLEEIKDRRLLRKRKVPSFSVPEAKRQRVPPKENERQLKITSILELQERRRTGVQSRRLVESEDGHEDCCAVCHGSGQVLMCDSCSRVYHLRCLDPPLRETPPGVWICPQCRKNLAKKGAIKWSGTLMVVRSFLEHKSECEEEKKGLIAKINRLRADRSSLEEKARLLSNRIMLKIRLKSDLVAEEERMRLSLLKLENVVASFAAIN